MDNIGIVVVLIIYLIFDILKGGCNNLIFGPLPLFLTIRFQKITQRVGLLV